MMIARGKTGDGGEFLLIGLSKVNIERLQAGQPIRITRARHGDGVPEGWFIGIMAGESELDMQRQLEKAGAIGPKTKINIDPRLT